MLNISIDNRTISSLSQMSVQVSCLSHKNILTSFHFPISVCVNHREILGIIGNNGCGKTTFLQILIGNINPLRGKVTTKGQIAFLSTKNFLKPNLTVKIQLPFFSKEYKNFPWKDWLNKKYENLSAGQQRLIAIWIVLNQKADIYIIDEPFIFLDNSAKLQVCEWINLKTTKGACIIFSNQNTESIHSLPKLQIVEL